MKEIQITRANLEYKYNQMKQNKKEENLLLTRMVNIIIVCSAVEIGAILAAAHGLNLFSIMLIAAAMLINLAVLFFVPLFKSMKYELDGLYGFKGSIDGLLCSLKYRKILSSVRSYTEYETQIPQIEDALKKEKKHFNILTLLELELDVYLFRNELDKAELVFNRINELWEKKVPDGILPTNTKLAYYGTIEDRESYIRTAEEEEELLRRYSRSSFKYTLSCLGLLTTYERMNGNYAKALEMAFLRNEFIEKQFENDNNKAQKNLHIFQKAAEHSSLAELYLELDDIENAEENLYIASKECDTEGFTTPPLLEDELARLWLRLEKKQKNVNVD